jgi:hypothetical protein
MTSYRFGIDTLIKAGKKLEAPLLVKKPICRVLTNQFVQVQLE